LPSDFWINALLREPQHTIGLISTEVGFRSYAWCACCPLELSPPFCGELDGKSLNSLSRYRITNLSREN
jgi:hypothetical protein